MKIIEVILFFFFFVQELKYHLYRYELFSLAEVNWRMWEIRNELQDCGRDAQEGKWLLGSPCLPYSVSRS